MGRKDSLEVAMDRIKKLEKQIKKLKASHESLLSSGVSRLNDYLSFHDDNDCVTVRLSGVNLQIVNGEGRTANVNCKGNLILGYNELPTDEQLNRSGSHNLILGIKHNYSSYGGIVSGSENNLTGKNCTVISSYLSRALADNVTIVSGTEHHGQGPYSTFLGGFDNGGAGFKAVFLGGSSNRARHSDNIFIGGVAKRSSNGGEIIPAIS